MTQLAQKRQETTTMAATRRYEKENRSRQLEKETQTKGD